MDTLTHDMVAIWRKLGRMIATGVPLLKAMRSIAQETGDEKIRTVLGEIVRAVDGGQTVHEAMSAHPGLFPPSVLSLVQVGELTGTLEKSAMAIADGLADGSFALSDAAGPAGAAPAASPDAALARMLDQIFAQAIEARASDIHFSVAGGKPRLRLRLDGVLTAEGLPALTPEQYRGVIARIKIMAGMEIGETQKIQDGRIRLSLQNTTYDLRVNCTPCAAGDSVVMRILPRTQALPSLEALLGPGATLDRARGWLARPHGLIVVCGPTGSGKSTTLYAAFQEVNKPGAKLVSVEDPVEYALEGVDQVQVRPSHGITFASALRALLRQDPDVLLVGEIRDLETAQLTMQAALTGHLVLTSLHTADAPGAVSRLIDVGLPAYLVNSSIVGVLAQRLVRRICPSCRETYTPDADLLRRIRMDASPIAEFVRGKGCNACRQTGYRGRLAVHETFEPSDDLRAAVARGITGDELRALAVRAGMRTLLQDGLDKVARGQTTLEEVLRVCA